MYLENIQGSEKVKVGNKANWRRHRKSVNVRRTGSEYQIMLIGQIYIMTDTDAGDRLLFTLVPTNQTSVLLSTNHKPGLCTVSSKTAADCRKEPHLIRSFILRLPVVALVD